MPGGTSPLEYAGGSAAKWLSEEEDEEGGVVTVGPGKGGGLGSSSRNEIMGDMAEREFRETGCREADTVADSKGAKGGGRRTEGGSRAGIASREG